MFNSVVLDIAVGMVLIYLLYSLLVSIIGEIISSFFHYRAKVLQLAIARMLNDSLPEKSQTADSSKNFLQKIFNIFKKTPGEFDNTFAGKFYNAPSIKYLSESEKRNLSTKIRSSNLPSYITRENFAQTLLHLFRNEGEGNNDIEKIANALETNVLQIQPQTLKYIKNLFNDAGNDIESFYQNLIVWYNNTMERTSGWYKRRSQVILFCTGLFLAIAFNVDSIKIVSMLSKNDDARDKLTSMAIAAVKDSMKYTSYINQNGDSINPKFLIDSSLKSISSDIKQANNIMGLGWDFSSIQRDHFIKILPSDFMKNHIIFPTKKYNDSIISLKKQILADNSTLKNSKKSDTLKYALAFYTNKRNEYIKTFNDSTKSNFVTITNAYFTSGRKDTCIVTGKVPAGGFAKIWYIIVNSLPDKESFWGFLITALMLTLGAPFWFDTLKRLIVLRNAGTNPDEKKDKSKENENAKPVIKTPDIPKGKPAVPKAKPAISLSDGDDALKKYGDELQKEKGVLKVFKGYCSDELDNVIDCIQVNTMTEEDAISINSKYSDIAANVPIKAIATGKTKIIANSIEDFNLPELGISNQAKLFGWGTIGCVVKGIYDNDKYFLTCYHVLNGSYSWDKVTGSQNTIVFRNNEDVPISSCYKACFNGKFEIAWTNISNDMAGYYLKSYKNPASFLSVKKNNVHDKTKVIMRGGASGYTHGVIVHESIQNDYYYQINTNESKDYIFNDLFAVAREDTRVGKISQPGDSGSLITDENGNALGIVLAEDMGFTYAMKISNILSILPLTLKGV